MDSQSDAGVWCQVRDLYWTFRNFRNRVADFLRYRRVTANMDERFRDANESDLEADSVCIICREDMASGGRNKKLPCDHVFHLHCLRWVFHLHCLRWVSMVIIDSPRDGPTPESVGS